MDNTLVEELRHLAAHLPSPPWGWAQPAARWSRQAMALWLMAHGLEDRAQIAGRVARAENAQSVTPALLRAIDALAETGLVYLEPGAAQGWTKVALTERGREMCQALFPVNSQ